MTKTSAKNAATVLWIALIPAAAQLPARAQNSGPVESPSGTYLFIPDTISPMAKKILSEMNGPQKITLPGPNDVAAWRARRNFIPADLKEILKPIGETLRERYHPIVEKNTLGGVPVVDIRPPGWKENGKILIYTHGGGYVTGSSDFGLGGWVTEKTGLRIISIGYTLAPESKWDHTTDQVIAVFSALQEEGYTLKNMAILGDSAGGGLAAGAVLKMRDKGLGMPAAVVLWSPWADITESGDTYVTLKSADPILNYADGLKGAADAYADPKDQKNPYVSPVYGDYSKGFPPTLIQGGTKEIFLSDFIRQYRAIDTAGGTAVLDIYEGMPHVFQAMLFGSPEAEQSMVKMTKFLRIYLGYDTAD